MTFFWADPHFNDSSIIGLCQRPYASVAEMNEALIAKWNNIVRRENDTVWLLGDFGFEARPGSGCEDIAHLFHRLRGRKNLVVGNHDERNQRVLRLPWERAEKLVTFRDNGKRAQLCHYPLETWNGSNHGALMMHGHCHGNLEHVMAHRFDVGVDVFVEGPVEWTDLLALAYATPFDPSVHLGRVVVS